MYTCSVICHVTDVDEGVCDNSLHGAQATNYNSDSILQQLRIKANKNYLGRLVFGA